MLKDLCSFNNRRRKLSETIIRKTMDKKLDIIVSNEIVNNIPVLFVQNTKKIIKKVIFVFHKLLEDKTYELPLAYRLAKEDYFVVICDMYGHGEHQVSNQEMHKYEFNNVFKDIYHTAHDIRYVIQYLKLNYMDTLNFSNIGALGISIGASIALVAGYLLEEIKYVVSIIGTCSWQYIIDNSGFDSFKFHACSNPVMDYDSVREYACKHEPINNYDQSNFKPILFLNGKLDTTISLFTVNMYVQHLREKFEEYGKGNLVELKIYNNVGHNVTAKMVNDAICWMKDVQSKMKLTFE